MQCFKTFRDLITLKIVHYSKKKFFYGFNAINQYLQTTKDIIIPGIKQDKVFTIQTLFCRLNFNTN